MTKTTVQQFSFHQKQKSATLSFRGRMQCWWIFDFETDYRINYLR
jgi:hypothetical protein